MWGAEESNNTNHIFPLPPSFSWPTRRSTTQNSTCKHQPKPCSPQWSFISTLRDSRCSFLKYSLLFISMAKSRAIRNFHLVLQYIVFGWRAYYKLTVLDVFIYPGVCVCIYLLAIISIYLALFFSLLWRQMYVSLVNLLSHSIKITGKWLS